MTYYSVNEYLRDTFGKKLYKISIDAGMTCPNRDGSLGTEGCIFCNGGSGDFAQDAHLSVTEQINKGKSLVRNKMPQRESQEDLSTGKTGNYIAYFQAYTNTYAPVFRLKEIYMEAINHPDIAAISIATRPDCLPNDVINLLDECNKIKPVWVELGLQTIHKSTADYIRRGYDLEVYDDAVMKLKQIGIPQIITHVILGLPGESASMMTDTVKHVVETGSSGIKLQLLHVLKGTDLAKDYEKSLFECLTLEEYSGIVARCLSILPKGVVVHRITGDGNKNHLIAPMWSADKKRTLNYLNKCIREFEPGNL